MAEYQNREDARKRLHEIAEGLKNSSGERSQETDGFRLMYLLGTTDMNAEEAIHALEANERQAARAQTPSDGRTAEERQAGAAWADGISQGFLDSVMDEMADALHAHDLGDDSRLEEDTVYWGKIVGTAAEKLEEARRRRMQEESLRQQQIHRELLKASAISCLEIHDVICGDFNPYRRMFGNFTGVQFQELVDSLGDLVENVTETVIDVADAGVRTVVGAAADAAEAESGAAEDAPEPVNVGPETDGPEAGEPKAPYIPVPEDDFLHRNSEPEPVTEEELLRANQDFLSEEDEEYRRLIGYDGLVKEEEEAVAAAHPERAERAARRRARAAERAAQAGAEEAAAEIAGEAAGPEATARQDGPPRMTEQISGDAARVLARPSDDEPPVLERPEDKKLSKPHILGPKK